ncbi:MAG: adenosine kinase [Alphaproteobacteria bacterium]|nr:adenosine kinase [Alphaproteobacteria bacterium]
MAASDFDVIGIGNAIVDVLAKSDEAFLAQHKLAKGAMTLIDAPTAGKLYAAMAPAIECSGGSVANTMAGIASLGGRGAFIGKVCADQLGSVFNHDIKAAGVAFATPPAKGGPPTARCLIFVTPDGQRTMQTYLGACIELKPDDVHMEQIQGARITYLEGYLWDPPEAKEAFRKAVKIAHAAGRKVALSLSDPFCVGRHRAAFRDLVTGEVDILFANEAEICSLYETNSFDAAAAAVRGHVEIAALTRSAAGSVIVTGAETYRVSAAPVARVIDTTGAGDLYASGFLYGLTRGLALPTCGTFGSLCAAEIISHVGARPEAALHEIVASARL